MKYAIHCSWGLVELAEDYEHAYYAAVLAVTTQAGPDDQIFAYDPDPLIRPTKISLANPVGVERGLFAIIKPISRRQS